MTRLALWSALAIALAGGSANAQETEKTSHAPGLSVLPPASNWMVGETRSPVDYSPVVVATASHADLQLSIQCRGGRTEMVVSGTGTALRIEEYGVFYVINDMPPVAVALAPPAAGIGVALKGDVPRFLMALPEQGEIAFRVTSRRGETLQGRFELASVKKLLGRIATSCKWPAS